MLIPKKLLNVIIFQGYKNAYGLLESEKANLLGVNVTNDNNSEIEQTSNTPLIRMQSFLSTIHDQCYHMLGSGCHMIGRDFYQLPGLAPALLNSVFSNMEVQFINIVSYSISFIHFLIKRVIEMSHKLQNCYAVREIYLSCISGDSGLQIAADHTRVHETLHILLSPGVLRERTGTCTGTRINTQ